jgi:hypothetical protein
VAGPLLRSTVNSPDPCIVVVDPEELEFWT